MLVSTTDFQANMDKYLALIAHEDVFITLNGKPIAQMVPPKTSAVDSLLGLLKEAPVDLDTESIRKERLQRHEGTL